MRHFLIAIVVLLLFSCNNSKDYSLSAQAIVDKSIEVSGSDILSESIMSFDFRNKHYKATRQQGVFELERNFTDSTSVSVSVIRDVLSNTGFNRYVDGKAIVVPKEMIPRYSASVNSVHYFSVLPYGLNDSAVINKRLDDISIKDEQYHTIQITFQQEGGGEDYEDIFVYWIHTKTFKIGYFAYSYNEDDGKGMRFREAYNERVVNGVRFVDYNNYKYENEISLTDFPKLFENKKLSLVSKIELTNITLIDM